MTNETEAKSKKPIWEKWWFWGIIIFVIIIIASASGGEKKETQPEIIQPAQEEIIQPIQEDTQEEKEERERREEINFYSGQANSIRINTGNDLESLGNFLTSNPYPLLWTDEEKKEVRADIEWIQQGYKDAQELEPPEGMEEIHDTLLEGTKYFNDAMTDLTKTIDNPDSDIVAEEMNSKLDKGFYAVKKAERLIDEFKRENL